MSYQAIPYRNGFQIVFMRSKMNCSPVRTPDKKGKLVWRTYKVQGEAEKIARDLNTRERKQNG